MEGLGHVVSSQGTFTFERKPAAPTLKLKPQPHPGAMAATCKGVLCDQDVKLPLTTEGKLSVGLADCDGCTGELTGQKFVVEGALTPALIDLTEAAGNASASSLTILNDATIPFNVTSREGAAIVMNLETRGSRLAAMVLRRVAQGPVVFAADSPAAVPRSAVVVHGDAANDILRVVGNPKLVRDFDRRLGADLPQVNPGRGPVPSRR